MKLSVAGTGDRRILAAVRALETQLGCEFCQGSGQVSIVLVNNRRIHALNRQFLNHDRPTDVISFPLDVSEPGQPRLLGEVYVSRDQARVQAREYGVGYHDEVKRLILHGILHLLGLTHRQMEPYYREYLGDISECRMQNADRGMPGRKRSGSF
jgi:rRNA maturation RNase YbeY